MSKNSVKRDVRLQVAPGPLACSFEPDYNGCAAVIKGFSLTPAGLESPLAKRVKRGYVLVAVDDTVLTRMKHAEVKRLLQRYVGEGARCAEFCASTRANENARVAVAFGRSHRSPVLFRMLIARAQARARGKNFRAVVFLLPRSTSLGRCFPPTSIHSPKMYV